VALVSHGGTIRLLLLRVLDPADNEAIMRLSIGNTSYTVLEVADDGSVHMRVAADHSHLTQQAADKGERL
jgi:broad specificity phosphatase PhoE